jgi:hypothetical protein
MILLPIIAAWMLVFSLTMVLCVAARMGDLQQLEHTSASAGHSLLAAGGAAA